ncbi:MAG: DUF835 domain-containing protein [Candidatus Thermoplasmatota archaeon]|nr:DUF835 domain-containing protein [Candidatus Thermoplasmatota archaeon]
MVELPRGDISESRRGGAGVLELLLVDMQKRSDSGYIRCEAGALGGAVGQITVRDGTPSMVLFESGDGNLLIGHAALGALQEAAGLEGSQLSCHLDVDLDLIEDLHPLARLHLDDGESIIWTESSEMESWWKERQRTRRQWKKLDSWIPDAEDEVSESEFDLPPLPFHPGSELLPGMVAIIDTDAPIMTMKIATHIGSIGHPLLIMSRIPTERLESEFGVPKTVSTWLTEKGSGENIVNATLEDVRRKFDDFLFGNSRACIVLDGLEFLTGFHGFERTVELIRSLVDKITVSDHLLLIPVDLDVWDSRQRAILLREVDVIDNSRISHWAERPARLEGHPYCSDDWIPIQIPERLEPDLESEVENIVEVSNDANRYSISGLVEAWKEERQSEIEDVTEKTAVAVEAGEDLPDWAIAPSANRGPEDESPILESTEPLEEVSKESEVIEEEPPLWIEPEPEVVLGPKSATVNHRGNTPRRVRRTKKPKDGLLHAVESSPEVGEMESLDATVLSRQELAIAAERALDVDAAVILPEDVVTPRDGLDSAASSVRLISSDFSLDDGPDMRVVGMNAATRAASGIDQDSITPPLTSNTAAREASSRAQRTLHLTARLAENEKSSIRTMSVAFSGSSGNQETIWQRLKALEDKGISTQHIVDLFEVDPDGALKAIKEAEK